MLSTCQGSVRQCHSHWSAKEKKESTEREPCLVGDFHAHTANHRMAHGNANVSVMVSCACENLIAENPTWPHHVEPYDML